MGSASGITNGLEIFNSLQHGLCVLASNNDSAVRIVDCATMR